jgi:DNA-binding Xre family transcriptional regulator
VRINKKKLDFALARKMWRLDDLAAAMGMSRDALYQQLYKVKELRPITVGKMAHALEIPVEEIGI